MKMRTFSRRFRGVFRLIFRFLRAHEGFLKKNAARIIGRRVQQVNTVSFAEAAANGCRPCPHRAPHSKDAADAADALALADAPALADGSAPADEAVPAEADVPAPEDAAVPADAPAPAEADAPAPADAVRRVVSGDGRPVSEAGRADAPAARPDRPDAVAAVWEERERSRRRAGPFRRTRRMPSAAKRRRPGPALRRGSCIYRGTRPRLRRRGRSRCAWNRPAGS